ncbi:hypothetical protein C8T65DRAFT_692819 [Cerioporus squamosus]|nr:hypothetical protein C8T65DRAFT_692819 [Cerioporus squamosus]
MSDLPTQSTQNGAPSYPPGLRTPRGARILVLATQTPPLQNDAAANGGLTVVNSGSPLVINDTFDVLADAAPPRSVSPPPLTQRSRIDLHFDVIAGVGAFGIAGPLGALVDEGSQPLMLPGAQVSSLSLHPRLFLSPLEDAAPASGVGSLLSGSIELTPSNWGSTQTRAERPSTSPLSLDWTTTATVSAATPSVESTSPSPTASAAQLRSRASTSNQNSEAHVHNVGLDHGGQQGTAACGQTQEDEAAGGRAVSDGSTDYFAYFSSPPCVDPPHYIAHTLAGAAVHDNCLATGQTPRTSHTGAVGPGTPSGDLREAYHGMPGSDFGWVPPTRRRSSAEHGGPGPRTPPPSSQTDEGSQSQQFCHTLARDGANPLHSPEPQAREGHLAANNSHDSVQASRNQERRRDKGKGRAHALSSDPERDEAAGDPANEGEGDWDEEELREAQRQSMRQGLVRGTGGWRDSRPRLPTQSFGAGPSGHRDDQATHGAPPDTRDWGMRDDFAEDRSLLDGPSRRHSRDSCAGWSDAGVYRRAWDLGGRLRSQLLPQRSPLLRLTNMQHCQASPRGATGMRSTSAPYGENLPPVLAEERDSNSREGISMHYDDGQDQREEYGTEDGDWSGEEGEVLPLALCGDDDFGQSFEPTSAPEGGFPPIYHDDPEARLRGMATEWLRVMWTDPPKSVIFVDVFNYRYSEDDILNRRVEENLRRGMEWIAEETGFDVVPPEPEDGARTRARDLPFLWAIRGLTPDGVARALAQRTWSFPFISFYTSPRATTLGRWIMMLEGFLNGNERNIRVAILGVLEEQEMSLWIERMVLSNPDFAGWTAERAVNAVLRTLRIETMQLGNGNYVTNVFIRSPTRDLREWRLWVAELRSRRYRSFANGTGRVRYIAACGGCRSVGHPMHLCPFPRMHGWNGPEQGQGVFGERRQANLRFPQGPPGARRSGTPVRQSSHAANGRVNNRDRDRDHNRARGAPRRDDRSSRSAGPSSYRTDGRGPSSGRGTGKGSGRRRD